ncbi:MAG TPA: tRNA (adenosine(37)-N6)-threonylcarbamoyltransferase complex dimerization subunit type 1 TsaB [Bacteroidia bacterium]|nr:tRNA (adenosine(37)-N6)-threonylcarbamoyltransferase complex dimerization subunit type 1 TsaB [Bacteroidia bacterium]HMU19969.1 tRNA (adenosine(37)-N6)-threonylcarbamoyltransferase complex dimerization subunit type 1 TsaB [Bacteroidia bacterium]
MALLLHLETSTDTCSVCISDNETIIDCEETHNSKSHASLLAVFIDELLKRNRLTYKNIAAVTVSCGPGSYTGLRIGVATAKGLCFALNVPLISVPTLQSMANIANKQCNGQLLCPMIDARRMEVFTALLTPQLDFIEKENAVIIDNHFQHDVLSKNKICFFGNGAVKLPQSIKTNSNSIILEDFKMSATGLATLAFKKFTQQIFEDLAYFEPFYLKDFVGK